ncbi:hypothetical protein [Stenotrophomonas sp.]|uniref:hypothetical protein n=1 Tax=Stenotrophomonas sp. TaxID=69392 RepID=UPI0028988EEB|nr:hypothetical protein [Stenotrophomonas sp.]
MIPMNMRGFALAAAWFGVACLPAACSGAGPSGAAPVPESRENAAPTAAPAAAAGTASGNAPYAGVVMSYPHSGCSYQYSPVDFCDAAHRAQINEAIRTQAPNFNTHYILAQLDERKEYFQRSIVLIDSRDGTVYPLPIDAFSGPLVDKEGAREYGKVETSREADTFCVSSALLVYRAFEEGRFCFGFDGVRFTGHTTQYMQ